MKVHAFMKNPKICGHMKVHTLKELSAGIKLLSVANHGTALS
jgi:hypothetical protein